eukprot:g12645.t1 g12645   contig6:2342448-2343665(-)
MASEKRHSEITPERVSRLFGIGLNKAHQLLRVTTQRGVRMAVNPITRRYRVDHLDLNLNRLKGVWEVDWLVSKVKSITQSTGCFVYTNGVYTEVYPQETHAATSARDSLNAFIEDVGAPEGIKTDSAAEFTGRNSEFAKLCRKRSIRQTFQEAGRSNQIPHVDVQIRNHGVYIDDFDVQPDAAYGDEADTPTTDEYGGVEYEEVNDADIDSYDKFLGAKIRLSNDSNNGANMATVVARATDYAGRPIGKASLEPAA